MSISVDISSEEGCALAIDDVELKRVFGLVLHEEGVERPCRVSVSVVSEGAMAELNAEWRGVSAPTDVISLECERPDDPDLAPGEPCELGDIAMAPSVLAAQAARFGTSAEDECRLMAIHSLLHLLGYDHIVEAEALVMEAREDELLALACGREMGHVALTRHEGEEGLSCGPNVVGAACTEAGAVAADAPGCGQAAQSAADVVPTGEALP